MFTLPHVHYPYHMFTTYTDIYTASTGVIELDSRGIARVVNPRLDTMSREVLRHDEFAELVTLQRVRDHFICLISSRPVYIRVGFLPSSTILLHDNRLMLLPILKMFPTQGKCVLWCESSKIMKR